MVLREDIELPKDTGDTGMGENMKLTDECDGSMTSVTESLWDSSLRGAKYFRPRSSASFRLVMETH
jgi:hypothetical protein